MLNLKGTCKLLLFKNKKILIAVLLTVSVIFVGSFFPSRTSSTAFAENSVRKYVESTDEIVNPAAGFYKAITVKLEQGVSDPPVGEYTIEYYSKDFGLYHLLFDLSAFSSNAGGTDAEIDPAALSAAAKVFGFLRKHKMGAIVRFDYNREGTQSPDGKYINAEPPLELVLKHIQNVSAVISEYSDVVLGVESGMLGPWGEQHSTVLANSGPHTYYLLLETWLDNTPETMGITTRRPLYFTYWANEKFGLGLSVSDLANFDASSYPSSERVGVYNDGYLGSSSDLGTFTDRAAETAFIGRQAERTYYGGELVADSQTGLIGDYNSVDHLEQEGFITHTSYLNIDWNGKVFEEYGNRTYNGVDELYRGKTTEFTFVKNRLGYRFYLSESFDAVVNKAGEARFRFTVANAGFARILCPSRSELVFTDGTNEATVDCNVNLSQIPSAGSKEFDLSVALPDRLPVGVYDVYLRFYTEYGAEICFANDGSVCAPDRKGVKIASVDKKAIAALTGIEVTTQPTKTTYTVGEAIDLTGLVVTATYGDGTSAPITVTTSMLSGYDMTTAGTKTVTVTYEEGNVTKTAQFTVAVETPPPTLTGITAVYSGKEYYSSESFDAKELVVKAQYSDGSFAVVTDYSLSAFDMTEGTKNVTVTYKEGDVTKTSTFTFTVKAVRLTAIAVTTQPTKKTYTVGEAIDLTGLVVTATYSDGTSSQINVTTAMLSGYDMTTAGTKTVTVTYKEGEITKTCEFTITVNSAVEPSKTLTGIAVTTQPTKKTYTVGEAIDLTGLVVTATYSDGTSAPITVTTAMLTGCDTSVAGKQTVTVAFENKTATFDITVKTAADSEPPQNPSGNSQNSSDVRKIAVICLSVAVAVSCLALVFALLYKKRK